MDLLGSSQPIVQEGAKKTEEVVVGAGIKADNTTLILIGVAILGIYLYNKNKK